MAIDDVQRFSSVWVSKADMMPPMTVGDDERQALIWSLTTHLTELMTASH